MSKLKQIIVALDFATLPDALALAERLSPDRCRMKVGKELYTGAGPEAVTALVERGFEVFLDLKFHDIPRTVAGACRAAADLGCWMVNVHASGGSAMLEAACESIARRAPRPLVTAVTVLTSLDADALHAVGVPAAPREQVARLAGLAHAAGVDGIVCSPLEIEYLRACVGADFILVVPGVRSHGAAHDNQARVATPASAIAAGADFLVVGRPITRSADPAAALAGDQRRVRARRMSASTVANAMSGDKYSPFSPVLPAPGERLQWSRLYGAAKSIALAEAARQRAGPVVVIAADVIRAQHFEAEFAFFAPDVPRYEIPDWETLPYDRFSPYQDIISARIATLGMLPELSTGVLIIPTAAIMHRLAPCKWLAGRSFQFEPGERLERDDFRRRLVAAGYNARSQVEEHGDFAIRGSIIDVFPMGFEHPFRIDLFDDEIDSLRLFDVETQRSLDPIDRLELLPARELPLNEEGIAHFRRAWRLEFEGRPQLCSVFQDVSEGLVPAGIEYYLPLFFDQLDTLFDYLPVGSLIAVDEGVEEAAEKFSASISDRYESLRHDCERPIVHPQRMFLDFSEVEDRMATFARLNVQGIDPAADSASREFNTHAPVAIPVDVRAAKPFRLVNEYLARFDGRILFLADSSGRRETITELFRSQAFDFEPVDGWLSFLESDTRIGLAVAPLVAGMEMEDPRLSIVTEVHLFGERAAQQRRRRRASTDKDAIVRNLTELTAGDPVVHEQHGVGRYRGLEVLSVGGISNEFIKIEYADGDNLYVPVNNLNLVSRYSGVDPDHAPLHKLGSGQWDKARRKAAEKIRDVAAELLEIHARRAARKGREFTIDRDAYRTFEQAFPFEETADQISAVEAVLDDMQRERPMDRLICGDVGFGKTEVAMRAAFVAVNDGAQVAILVPTTLLALQHFETLKDRFADWPVRVEHVSRLRDSKSTRDALSAIAQGTADIVVGTHKLLTKDIRFKRLGLIVIDEEHRFGVRQKEKLKALRTDVDILTLTATPIPRTLNLALAGTRELSVIATAPLRRLAIKTFVREWSTPLLREAMLREIGRGGQVYFLHNKVETIEDMAQKVSAILPEARVRVAHGQMRERDLEQVMLDFYHGRCNVLICTTIIETGIDVPNANTMIINRADKFGLAQLYQLRGRVGRSHHRAYAYLVVSRRQEITPDAIKRLETIESLEDLGVGFTLATHDLEIRGAGEILGEAQSGHIQEIGFGLYSELLNRTVAALKAGQEIGFDLDFNGKTEIELHIPVLLPEDYIPDVHTRLILYKRISSAQNELELNDLREEIIDRFGIFALPVVNLFRHMAYRLRAEALGIRKIDLGRNGGRVEFHAQPNIDPTVIVDLVQTDPDYRLDGSEKLKIRKQLPDAETRFGELESLFAIFNARSAA